MITSINWSHKCVEKGGKLPSNGTLVTSEELTPYLLSICIYFGHEGGLQIILLINYCFLKINLKVSKVSKLYFIISATLVNETTGNIYFYFGHIFHTSHLQKNSTEEYLSFSSSLSSPHWNMNKMSQKNKQKKKPEQQLYLPANGYICSSFFFFFHFLNCYRIKISKTTSTLR